MGYRDDLRRCAGALLAVGGLVFGAAGVTAQSTVPASQPAASQPTNPHIHIFEHVPSEDPVIKGFHSLGLINGQVNIFRCGSPVRDLVVKGSTDDPTPAARAEAKARMQHLYDLGIRTIISFENPWAGVSPSDKDKGVKVKKLNQGGDLEETAAAEVGITYVSHPLSNSGKNSLEDMSVEDAMKILEAIETDIFAYSKNGGVVFHCAAGHDRTGIVAAYVRIKDEHWPVDQAIDEMRRYGHNYVVFSHNGGVSSWHEDLLRQIAKILAERTVAANATMPATAPAR